MTIQTRLLAIASAVLAAAALSAQQNPSDTVRNPLDADPTAAAAGQQLYNQTCQACHGPAGQGDRGPALNTATFAHGSEDADVFQSIRTGIAGTQMSPFPRLTDNQIWQLVSYIHKLQGIAPGDRGAASSVAGDADAGETLFFGKAACSGCHEVNGRGGITGPDLSNAGRLSPAAIRQKIVDPSNPPPPTPAGAGAGRGAPPPVTIVARTADGREIRGVRRNEDTFSLQMVDASGAFHLLDKKKLSSVQVENRSLMPGDFATRLSPADITNLVAYLSARRGRDLTKTITQPIAGGVTIDRLRNAKAEPQNWLMYWGDYQGTHYSPLKQITPPTSAG